jgi:hypothetical protein
MEREVLQDLEGIKELLDRQVLAGPPGLPGKMEIKDRLDFRDLRALPALQVLLGKMEITVRLGLPDLLVFLGKMAVRARQVRQGSSVLRDLQGRTAIRVQTGRQDLLVG